MWINCQCRTHYSAFKCVLDGADHLLVDICGLIAFFSPTTGSPTKRVRPTYRWVLRDLAAFAGVPLPEPDESDPPLYPATSAHTPSQQPYHVPFPYPLPQVVSGSEQHPNSHLMHREATFSQYSLNSLDGYILGLHRAHSLHEPNQSMPDPSAFDPLIPMPSHLPIHHMAARGYQNPPATSRDQVER